jgi:hypothetical protein
MFIFFIGVSIILVEQIRIEEGSIATRRTMSRLRREVVEDDRFSRRSSLALYNIYNILRATLHNILPIVLGFAAAIIGIIEFSVK